MVSKEKMASALDFDPLNSSYWSKNRHDIVFGANYNAFAIKFTGFSICHPVFDDTNVLKYVQHSLRSAMSSELPTATFLFLSNGENKSINAYRAFVRNNPNYCTTLGFIPKTKLTYAVPTSWKGVQLNISSHTWSMDIIAVWNNEAKQRLSDASPNWLQTLQRSITEAVWENNQYLAREDTDHITNHVCPQYFKSKREDVTGQERGQNANVHPKPWDDKQFELKCPKWKLWAYTDGSCIGKAGNLIGAGVYCPQTKAGCYVDSGGVGMTNTINRAELTGIAAALTNKYTQIAMDSACSLSQFRKQLLFPEMQRAHIHSNLLKQNVSMIYASPEPICFYNVKAQFNFPSTPTGTASLPRQTAPSALALIVHFTYSQVVNTLK